MRISDMNWMQVEEYLRRDDRAVLPLGSTEQHSHLRLTVDCILPERVAADAAEPLGVPVFPVVAYGVTPYFREFPGSISLRVETHLRVVRDILDGMAHSGFRRILIVNGHGGNGAVQQFAQEWAADHPGCRVLFHNWWNAPSTWAKVQAIDPVASHGSWMENFPWTRLPGVELPKTQRPMVDMDQVRMIDPVALRGYIGDGNYGGLYQRSDEDMLALWQVAVEETRARCWTAPGAAHRSGTQRARCLVWGAGAIGGTAGRVPVARRSRRDPGRHRRRARRRDQSLRAQHHRADRGVHHTAARVHSRHAARRPGTPSSSRPRRITPRPRSARCFRI